MGREANIMCVCPVCHGRVEEKGARRRNLKSEAGALGVGSDNRLPVGGRCACGWQPTVLGRQGSRLLCSGTFAGERDGGFKM